LTDSTPGSAGMRAEQYLAPATIGQLTSFEFRARMIAEGVMSGMHRSPYQGLAVEFAEHRQYVSGDDLKHLDWKVFGRSDKLYLKQYQQETNLDVIILVDASASMRFGTLKVKQGWGGTDASGRIGTWTKFDHATAVGAALCYLALQQRDRVGLSMFADGIQAQVKRSNTKTTWRNVVRTLATEPVDDITDFGKVVEQSLATVSNRSLFVIVSDFLVPTDTVRAGLARLRHRRHDVMLMQVLDRQELRFDLDEPSPFEGLEGEGRVNIDPRVIREDYLAALTDHCSTLEKNARSLGFDYLRLDSHGSVGPALAAMLGRRALLARGGRAG
jgi:uncharacterized protein (DUF58 family)